MNSDIFPLRKNHLNIFLHNLKNCKQLRIISPFVTRKMTTLTLESLENSDIKLITRYNLKDFYQKVSDLRALKMMIDEGVKIRGVKRLHSKIYIFNNDRVVVSSANFTAGGMETNFEFGLFVRRKDIVEECIDYFNFLWKNANNTLKMSQLNKWEKRISTVKPSESDEKNANSLTDEGADLLDKDISDTEENMVNKVLINSDSKGLILKGQQRFFIKIFGDSKGRVEADKTVREEVKKSECHYAVCYPAKKRPRQVNDGDIIYMSRMLRDGDYAIFGKAIGYKHLDEYDNATPAEIKRTWLESRQYYWKDQYPRYIRVHSPEFIDNTFDKCPMLKRDLFNKFRERSLVSTSRNKLNRSGNIDPVKSLSEQAAVEITMQAALWLDDMLKQKMDQLGRIPGKFIDGLPQSKRKAK